MSCNSPISILAQAPYHRTSIPQVLARPSCVAMKAVNFKNMPSLTALQVTAHGMKAVKTMKAMKTTALHLFLWKVPLKNHFSH